MDEPRILVVDDELSIRHVLQRFLEKKRCVVKTAASAEKALELLDDFRPATALLDIVLPGKSGIDLLAELRQWDEDCQVIMITSHGSVETAVGAIRLGAYDYLRKPFENLEEIWLTVRRALEKHALIRELRRQKVDISKTVRRLSSLLELQADQAPVSEANRAPGTFEDPGSTDGEQTEQEAPSIVRH